MAGLILTSNRGMRQDMARMESQLREDMGKLESRLRDDIKQIADRMDRVEYSQAKLEGGTGGNPDPPPAGYAPIPETKLPNHQLHRSPQQHDRRAHSEGQTLEQLSPKTQMGGLPHSSTSNLACDA